MATKVNKQFVLILILIVGGMIVAGGAFYYHRKKHQDPKQLVAMAHEAEKLDVPLLMGETAERQFSQAAVLGLADEDFSGVVRVVEAAAGTTISPGNSSET